MKLSKYAEIAGISYRAAYQQFRDGNIPGAFQLPAGTIVVPESVFPGGDVTSERVETVVYARVSSSEQRHTNLESQAERMVGFCAAHGWVVDRVVKEVGSGLNDERKLLVSVLQNPRLLRIVVEHRDRLTRFGYNYLQVLADLQGFQIVVANKTLDGDKSDLMADFTAIITSFCARLYSRRRGKHKADRLKAELSADD